MEVYIKRNSNQIFKGIQVDPSCFIYFVDRYGFNVMGMNSTTDPKQWTDIRFPFPFEIKTIEECISAFQESVTHAQSFLRKDQNFPKLKL